MKTLYILIISLITALFFAAGTYAASPDTQKLRKPKTDANITGHVESAATLEHLPYVAITVRGTTINTATDATGHFLLKDLPEGEFVIEASAVGYKKSEQRIVTVANRLIECNFLMEEQMTSLDEVVVSATRNETSKKEAPIIVNVVSSKLFESTASANLAESMCFQPGLRVENNCGNCGTTQLRINGLDGEYSQILLDSRPVFSSLATVYGLEQLPVSMIERVEVIRGGGSALFGSSAIGGVVNIITKEPLRNSATIANITNLIDGKRRDINTSFNGSFVSDDHRAGIYLFGMVKDRQWYDRDKDGFSDIPKLNSETIGFRGYYRTGTYSRLSAEYHHISEFRRGGNEFDSPPHEADIAEQLRHKIDGGGLRFNWNSPNNKHRMSAFISAQSIDRSSYFGAEKSTDGYGQTDDKTFVVGTQYTAAFDRLLFLPAELTAGVEFNYNKLHDRFVGLGRDTEQRTRVWGGFVQNEWKDKKWSLLVGARLDKHNMMDDAVISPRANVRYSPNESVGLRASYSSGYRAPQAYNEDLHVEAVGGMLSVIDLADGLKSEYSHSVSGSADLYHSFGRLQTNLLIEGFYTYLKDVFTLEETGSDDAAGIIYYERRNGSGATIYGLNLEAKIGIPGRFEVQLGYTSQRSRYKEPESWTDDLEPQRRMFRAPDNYGYITSNINLTKNLTASVFGNYTGSMLVQHSFSEDAVDVAAGEPLHAEKKTRDFWDLGFKLGYTFYLSGNMSIEINGGVKNIFDSFQKDLDYGSLKDASYVYGPQMPRVYFMGIKISL